MKPILKVINKIKKKKGKLHFLYILNVISYHKFSN